MKLFKLERPARLLVSKVFHTALYVPCAGCGEKEPVIYGYVGRTPSYDGIQVRVPTTEIKGYRLAVYCEPCFKGLEAKLGE